MEWYGYVVIIMGTMLFFLMITLFLARYQIKLRLKAFIFRAKGYVKYTELTNEMKISEGVAKVSDGGLTIGNKKYSISKTHVYLNPMYGMTEVLLSEQTGTSINPEGVSILSPTVTDGLIKRVKATALGESLKIIKYMTIALGVLGVAVIFLGYISFRVYTVVNDAGIKINL